MPGPVSVTLNRIISPPCSGAMRSVMLPPSGVTFDALDTRFDRTCGSLLVTLRLRLPFHDLGSEGHVVLGGLRLECVATLPERIECVGALVEREAPESILARSSRSPMSRSMRLTQRWMISA